MKQIDADALEEKLDKIPARRIENADGRAYVLIRLSTVFEIIKQMPSAQPEAPCYLGSPCEYQNPNAEIQEERTAERTESHACDLISRQAAIDAIEQLVIPEDMCVFEILSHIELAIGTLPSTQPEPERTMEEFMYGQDMGNPEDGSL